MTEIAQAFRALADPTRQKMLVLLEAHGELCVSEVGEHFAMAQPSISHHLRTLRQAGLVRARKRGKEIHYAIDGDELSRCCGVFFARFECCRPLFKQKRLAKAGKGGTR